MALVEGDTSRLPQLTPEAQVQGAKLVHKSVRPPLVFLDFAAESPRVWPRLTIRLPEVPICSLDMVLPLSLILADLPWQACWLGKESKLEGIGAAPEQGGSWKPIRLPKEWQELGVTWVRTRVVVPEAWQEHGLRLNLGAVDDRDITFFNGRQIGRTDGWDKPRSYAIPRDTVAWGRENEIAADDEDEAATADPDQDDDGFADTTDACPENPEDADGQDDDDGCPEFTIRLLADTNYFVGPSADAEQKSAGDENTVVARRLADRDWVVFTLRYGDRYLPFSTAQQLQVVAP